jgi:hypothetical protein
MSEKGGGRNVELRGFLWVTQQKAKVVEYQKAPQHVQISGLHQENSPAGF